MDSISEDQRLNKIDQIKTRLNKLLILKDTDKSNIDFYVYNELLLLGLLNEYKIKYLIQYKSITIELNEEIIFLENNCDINTFKNGWVKYAKVLKNGELINEIYEYYQSIGSFSIINIQKLWV